MEKISMKIMGKDEQTLAVSHSAGYGESIVYAGEYRPGERIVLSVGDAAGLYAVRLDEALPEAVVYIPGGDASFPVPMGEERICYSPKAFSGGCHVITARRATTEECAAGRNLAFNPYDRHMSKGMFPHATANVETRNEAVFAARNAIDGVFENSSHGIYPYSSWGINQNPNAELRLDFGRPVNIESIAITLRADFPHDNWWRSATVAFSDESELSIELKKTHLPQCTPIESKMVSWLMLKDLIKADDPSPFPALTQLEVFGHEG